MKKRLYWLTAMALTVGMLSSASVPVYAEEASTEGMYRSELTNEWIDEALKDQRPIAAMVDNELIALPHYGTADSDVVYEMMNSTANDRITRLMVLIKDWEKIGQLGSIRSTRSTNIPLAAEWNAVLCHDGGPFYVDAYFAEPYAKEHFSGGFTRVNNGKAIEFTEYITAADLESKFASTGFSRTYNEFRPEDDTHFQFIDGDEEYMLDSRYTSVDTANTLSLPFYHNQSKLTYNTGTGLYEYSEYGELHKDAETDELLTFKNVLIQSMDFTLLDKNGYMVYQYVGTGDGYYLTNGEAIPITWEKTGETEITRFYDQDGEEITLNTGKTYIALVPSDTWGEVAIQ